MVERRLLLGAAAGVLLLVAAPLPLAAQDANGDALEIVRPWARPTVPVQRNGAVYLILRNLGAVPDRLIGARTDKAREVKVHDSTVAADGVARMRPQESIVVPPAGEVVLAPGGLHLMLVGLDGPLTDGTRFPLALRFEHAGERVVEVDVTVNGASGAKQQDATGHGAH